MKFHLIIIGPIKWCRIAARESVTNYLSLRRLFRSFKRFQTTIGKYPLDLSIRQEIILIVNMKFAICFVLLVAAMGVSRAQLAGGGAPPVSPGWLIGQGASINAVSLAVNGALASNADASTLPPELQVIDLRPILCSEREI